MPHCASGCARTRRRRWSGTRPSASTASSSGCSTAPAYTDPVNPQHAKQLFKNGVYRTLGETTLRLGVNTGERPLSVLMYHKVNDIPDNPLTVPVSVFDEQMALVRELGYQVVDLEAVLAYYDRGTPLPERAVLITFDDGYEDVLVNALP